MGLHGRGLKMLRAARIVVAAPRRLMRRKSTLRALGAGSRRRAPCRLARIFGDDVAAIGAARPLASAEPARPAGRLAHRGRDSSSSNGSG